MTDNTPQQQKRSMAEVLQDQVRAEVELSRRLAEYKGCWVAVHDHEVVASAHSLNELVELVDDTELEFFLEVPEVRAPASFF